jgi:hypothetical protein
MCVSNRSQNWAVSIHRGLRSASGIKWPCFPLTTIAVPLGFAACSILEYSIGEQSDGTVHFRS